MCENLALHLKSTISNMCKVLLIFISANSGFSALKYYHVFTSFLVES
jgi:hypothetical protein